MQYNGTPKIKKNMLKIKSDYFVILIFLFCSVVLTTIIIGASYLIIPQNPDVEKISPYECGFDPFEDARNEVDVRFYLVAILFIIFDIEVAYLYPWAVVISEVNSFNYWIFIDFMCELVVGLFYAWRIGSLEWQ